MTFLLVVILIAVLATYLCAPLFEPMLYHHLTVGHWIDAQGVVPLLNYWDLSRLASVEALSTWATTSWLFEFLLARIERIAGLEGLLWVKLALSALLIASLVWLFVSRSKDLFVAMVVTSIVACGVLLNSELGPQLLALSLVVMFSECLFRVADGLGDRGKTRGAWSSILVLSIVAAQVSAVLLPVAPVLVLIAFRGVSLREALPRACVVLMFVAVAHVLTPYFGGQLWFEVLAVQEIWVRGASATVYQFAPCFLILLAAGCGVLLFEREQRLSVWETIVSLVVVGASLYRSSWTAFGVLYFGLLFCLLWSRRSLVSPSNLQTSLELFRGKLARLPRTGTIWVLGCMSFINIVKLSKLPVTNAFFPVAEIDFLLEQRWEVPVFYPPDIGPYVLHRLTDGRGSLRQGMFTPATSGGVDVIGLGLGWKHEFETVSPHAVLVRYDSPLYTYLAQEPGWTLMMRNGVSALEPEVRQSGRYSWVLFIRDQLVAFPEGEVTV